MHTGSLGRALVTGSLGTMLQHGTGCPASFRTRCCPREGHITDWNGQMPLSHFPRTLTPVATRICHQTGHSDETSVHRVMHTRCCASPMCDCAPNIAQCTLTRIFPHRPSPSFNPGGWNRLACFPGCSARYCAQQSARWTEKVQIAIHVRSTNCMPTPQL